jgi:hypothetical protein
MKVIRYKDLPVRPPLTLTAVVYLLLDRFHAPAAAWGALGVLLFLVWIACIASIIKQQECPVQFGEPER